MNDDLVKWLREKAFRTETYKCLNAAASRIEKLEALVEQLRDDNSSMIDDYDADLLRQEKRIEKLEAAMRRIADLTERWEYNLISQVNEIARKALEGKDD